MNFKKQNSGIGQRAKLAPNEKKGEDNRKYEKPWQVPKKEKKEASTFMEYHYPDGVGPDTDLINMLERDVLDKNP